ncbi:MAG: SRPBCC family protein [Alphaproteobacteria bacterium]
MKEFRDTVVVKQPPDALWRTVRDRLPELAAMIDDIDSIEVVERDDADPACVRLVNRWRSGQRIPGFLHKPLGADAVSWIDRNSWDEAARICRWQIEPSVLPDKIRCDGSTAFEPAMGGRGTRVTFAGRFELAPGALRAVAGPLERQVAGFVESVVTVIVPRNLRRMMDAAAKLIAGDPA